MTDELTGDWRSDEQHAKDVAQAKALREQASKGGLKFEVFLTSDLAEWVLNLVAKDVFTDPSDAVFLLMQEQQELAGHADLRKKGLSPQRSKMRHRINLKLDGHKRRADSPYKVV